MKLVQLLIKSCSLLLLLLSLGGGQLLLQAQEITYVEVQDIAYYHESQRKQDAYLAERCKLDIYYPENVAGFPTIVWFHGGGIKSGNKHIPDALKDQEVAVVAVNYRLHPKVYAPKYIEDAAAAVAWVFNEIQNYGGDSSLIFLSGHSAGGYLASMVGMDKHWLEVHEIDANRIAGLLPLSGHTITHFTIRDEQNIAGTQPIIDEYAPLFHVRADAPPLLLITGDRELELLGRYEENAYMMRMMKVVEHPDTELYEMDGYGHGIVGPALPLVLKKVRNLVKRKDGNDN